jgi:hypothetical protein
MREAKQLSKDRRRYHLHAATFLIAVLGLLGTLVLAKAVEPRVASWIGAGFAALLAISGVFAIAVERTLFSKRAEDTEGFDLEGYPGDAIETPGLWSTDYAPFANLFAPYLVLAVGLLFCAGFVFFALR